jgi:hypothetical protein
MEKYYVAFLDVLGFTKKVEDADTNEKNLELLEYLKIIKKGLNAESSG